MIAGDVRLYASGSRRINFCETSALPFSFHLQECGLALDSPAVSSERAVSSDDAMARHGQSDWVGGAGAGHGTDSARVADLRCDLAVAASSAVGDAADGVPYFALKHGRLQIERQVKRVRLAF